MGKVTADLVTLAVGNADARIIRVSAGSKPEAISKKMFQEYQAERPFCVQAVGPDAVYVAVMAALQHKRSTTSGVAACCEMLLDMSWFKGSSNNDDELFGIRIVPIYVVNSEGDLFDGDKG